MKGKKRGEVTLSPKMRKMLRENLTPVEMALLATLMTNVKKTGEKTMDRGFRWFAEEVAGLLGGWEVVGDILYEELKRVYKP